MTALHFNAYSTIARWGYPSCIRQKPLESYELGDGQEFATDQCGCMICTYVLRSQCTVDSNHWFTLTGLQYSVLRNGVHWVLIQSRQQWLVVMYGRGTQVPSLPWLRYLARTKGRVCLLREEKKKNMPPLRLFQLSFWRQETPQILGSEIPSHPSTGR